jgi:hypothetical protein
MAKLIGLSNLAKRKNKLPFQSPGSNTVELMDVVSFAFATISVVENLIHTYQAAEKFIHDVKHFDGDREILIARITAEKTITLRLKTLLFAPAEGPNNPSLFQQLDDGAQGSLYAIFTLFAKALQRYLPLDEQYGLSDGNRGSDVRSMREDGDTSLTGRVQGLKKNLRPVTWALWDKKRVTNFVEEIEAWNKKITQLVELHVLSRRVYTLLKDQPPLRISSTLEARELGIQDALVAQEKALILPSPEGISAVEDFERKWTELKNAKKHATHWNFEIGRFEDSLVVLDAKLYDGHPSEAEKDAARARLNQLASVLQNLHRLEDVIPECLCWMNRSDKSAHSLLFKIPADLEPQPQSLYDALPDTSVSSGPLLDERLKVAYRLASAVDSLHSVSWIHKSIRSENILFFYTKSSVREPEEEASAGRMLPPKWFLFGFEYARTMDAETSFKSDADRARNTYRHPQRWGVPTTAFGPIHDIYALGVVLLELGIWRKATSVVKLTGIRPLDPFRVRNDLLERATKYLGYAVGTTYRDVVLRCLRSDFGAGIEDDYDARMRLAARFRSLVVDELQALAFPHLDASQQIKGIAWESGGSAEGLEVVPEG